MAAGEDQPQHVVVERGVTDLVGGRCVKQQFVREFALLAAKRDLPANPVDRLVAPHIDQPCPRIGRRIGLGPALQRHRDRILQRVLGKIEIADEADQRGQHASRLVAEYLFDFGWCHAVTLLAAVIPGRPKDEPGIHITIGGYGFRACTPADASRNDEGINCTPRAA